MPFARVARVAREGHAGSWARPCVVLATISPTAALLLIRDKIDTARRELAGRLLGAALPCRNDGRVGQDDHGCCLLELGLGHLGIMNISIHRGVPTWRPRLRGLATSSRASR